MKKYLLSGLLCSVVAFPMLSSCAATQQESAVEQKTLREQEASATRFITSLFSHDMQLLQASVELPFFFNQQAILTYPGEWEQVLQRLRAQSKPSKNFNILEVEPLSPGQFLSLQPRIWAKLLEHRFDNYTYFKYRFRQPLSAEQQRKDPKGRRFVEGQMVVITDPQTAKIRGFIL